MLQLKTLQVLPRERESSDESDQYQNGGNAPLFRWREIRSRITVAHEPTMISFHSRSQPKKLFSTILRMSDTALQTLIPGFGRERDMENSFTDPALWHRIHFAFTITYHYLFPQLTMGLAWFLVYWKWRALRTGDEKYNRAAR